MALGGDGVGTDGGTPPPIGRDIFPFPNVDVVADDDEANDNSFC